MGSEQQFCLHWNSHRTNFVTVFDELLQQETLVDVTLACEGQTMKAHKLVLSASSTYFRQILSENLCPHPVIVLKDVKFDVMKAMITFMYKGEVEVSHDKLSSLLNIAENLKVKGLAEITESMTSQMGSSSMSGESSIDKLGCSAPKRRKVVRRLPKKEIGASKDSPADTEPEVPYSSHVPQTAGVSNSYDVAAASSCAQMDQSGMIPSTGPSQQNSGEFAGFFQNFEGNLESRPFDFYQQRGFTEFEDCAANVRQSAIVQQNAAYARPTYSTNMGMQSEFQPNAAGPSVQRAPVACASAFSAISKSPSTATTPQRIQGPSTSESGSDHSAPKRTETTAQTSHGDIVITMKGRQMQKAMATAAIAASVPMSDSSIAQMKAEFDKKVNLLLEEKNDRSSVMSDSRYLELIAETKQAKEDKLNGKPLIPKQYRRLHRYDVLAMEDGEKLIEKNSGNLAGDVKFVCPAVKLFDVIHSTHIRIGHKREKGMEVELKRKYCNVTREVVNIYLNLCETCKLKRKKGQPS